MPEAKPIAQFPCPSCGADMQFDPACGELLCKSCGRKQPVSTAERIVIRAHPIEEGLQSTALAPISTGALEVQCTACGSVVAFEPPEVAGSCPFCGDAIIAQPKAADPLIAPDGVLPAKVPKETAVAEIQQWLKTRWFAPNALKKLARQEGIGGVYLPFWTYCADTKSRYAGMRGVHYYVTETYQDTDEQGRSVTRTRQVQHTQWYPAAGQVSRSFEDLLIPATKSINEARLNALEPWDLPQLCVYEPGYLAGFKAQRYVVQLPDGLNEAKQVMARVIDGDVRRDIGGDEQQVFNVDTEYSSVTFRHLLLPVWIGAYRFQNKVYQVVVNARTGEVQGERPYSAIKITLLVITIILAIVILAQFVRH